MWLVLFFVLLSAGLLALMAPAAGRAEAEQAGPVRSEIEL
jgi:hypothetical protein